MFERLLDLLFPLFSHWALFCHRGIWGLKKAVLKALGKGDEGINNNG